MTEDRKPAKPGMEEVSPKFVDAAEAAVEATASTDEALSALWQDWQRACEANDKAVEDEDKAKLAKEAITDHETPEYRAATAEFEAAQRRPDETFAALMAVEGRIENTPARSVKGAAIKLRMAKYLIDIEHPDGPSDEAEMSREQSLTLSVLADLERLVAPGAVVTGTKDNGLPPLDGETVVRVEELANEVIDLNQGIRRLLNCDLEEIPTTGQVLTFEIDKRLARLVNLLNGENEDARS